MIRSILNVSLPQELLLACPECILQILPEHTHPTNEILSQGPGRGFRHGFPSLLPLSRVSASDPSLAEASIAADSEEARTACSS